MSLSDPTSGMNAARDAESDPVAPPSQPGREFSDESIERFSDPVAPPSQPGREELTGSDNEDALENRDTPA